MMADHFGSMGRIPARGDSPPSDVPAPLVRVFIVDDEPVIAHTLKLILSQHGFSAVAFTDPVNALEMAQKDPPDLLISDVLMPYLSGVELAIQIKALCPHCDIVLFSGQASTSDLLAEARARGHDFLMLQKPVLPSILLQRIQHLRSVSSRQES